MSYCYKIVVLIKRVGKRIKCPALSAEDSFEKRQAENKRTKEVKSLNFHSVTLADFTFSCTVHGPWIA